MADNTPAENTGDEIPKDVQEAARIVGGADGGDDQDTPKNDEHGDKELGDAGKRALDRERKARKDAEKKARDLAAKVEEFEAANRTDEEQRAHEFKQLTAKYEEATAKVADIESQLVRLKALATPDVLELAPRLRGDTEDEIREDAKRLQAMFGKRHSLPRVPEAGAANKAAKTKNSELFGAALRSALGN